MVKSRVLLWTAPRCVSTAFERSVRTLKNGEVFHEPFLSAYYCGPERQYWQFSPRPTDPQATYQAVCQMLQREYETKDFIFSKDLAIFVKNKFEIFLDDGFKDFKHTFLIRHPLKAIYSNYKSCTNGNVVGYETFDPSEAGFKELLHLYQFVERHVHKNPVVVDADDLLDFPKEIMQSYCEAVGLQYEDHMTSWEPGPVPGWNFPKGWHENVLKSSGFTAQSQEQKDHSETELPSVVAAAVEECMPYYDALRAKRICPKTVRKSSNLND